MMSKKSCKEVYYSIVCVCVFKTLWTKCHAGVGHRAVTSIDPTLNSCKQCSIILARVHITKELLPQALRSTFVLFCLSCDRYDTHYSHGYCQPKLV